MPYQYSTHAAWRITALKNMVITIAILINHPNSEKVLLKVLTPLYIK